MCNQRELTKNHYRTQTITGVYLLKFHICLKSDLWYVKTHTDSKQNWTKSHPWFCHPHGPPQEFIQSSSLWCINPRADIKLNWTKGSSASTIHTNHLKSSLGEGFTSVKRVTFNNIKFSVILYNKVIPYSTLCSDWFGSTWIFFTGVIENHSGKSTVFLLRCIEIVCVGVLCLHSQSPIDKSY